MADLLVAVSSSIRCQINQREPNLMLFASIYTDIDVFCMCMWKMPLVLVEIGRFGHVCSDVLHESSEHSVGLNIGAFASSGVWLEVGEVWGFCCEPNKWTRSAVW